MTTGMSFAIDWRTKPYITMPMNEKPKWPEARRFVDDFDVRLACAELMAEMLMAYGRTMWSQFGDSHVATVRTQAVDACDELEGRFQQALRVSECLYSYTHEKVEAAAPHVITHPEPLSDSGQVRAFALQLGTLDLDTVEEKEICPEDYEWQSLALTIIDIGDEDLLTGEHVTLIDAEDGTELTDEKTFELHGLLSALASELRANNFSDATILDDISAPELEQQEVGAIARAFRASDFIEGVGCDECASDHIICSHNGSAN